MKLKTLLPIFALVVLMAIPSMVEARRVHDIACEMCHKPGANLDMVASNICIGCHNPANSGASYPLYQTGGGNTNTIGIHTFLTGDASDARGSVSAQGETPGDQTSHNWAASDTNPAAGASAPSDPLFYGRSNYAGATVSCARCHNPHGVDVADGRSDANPKLLKLGENSTDAMCVDCHTAWDTTNANAYLTHPMSANYPTIQAANPSKFKPFQPNGEMTLGAGGDIVCSTCHGVHFTDSDAATTDGAGQAINIGDGFMLKGNGRLTGDASGICNSCHIYAGHSGGAVGCIDCHSGHSYNEGTPNFFILRDTVSLASYPVGAPANPGTNLAYTSATTPWKNGGNGYCEKCHTLAADHNGLTTGSADILECGQCHTHDDTAASFTAGVCNQCHGNPPVDNSQGPGTLGSTSTGIAFDPVTGYDYQGSPNQKSEVTGQHAIHAGSGASQYGFGCSDCHNGNGHKNGSFQEVFITASSFVSANSALSPAYNANALGTCSAVYCHSNGGARATAPVAATVPAWTSGTTTCSSCHGNSAATMTTMGNSNAHQAHLAKGYDCSVCHTSTAANANTLAGGAIQGTHVNGVADVVFDGSAPTQLNAVAGVYNTDGTCQTIVCHSDGANNAPLETPDWDVATTGDCGSCHDDTGEFLSFAHPKHVFDADGPGLACTTCHTNNGSGPDHVNQFVSFVPSMQTAVCDSCHGIDGAETSPVWTTVGSDDCLTCHTGASLSTIGTQAPDKNSALTTGHNLAAGTYSSGNSFAGRSCEDCHDKAATHLTGSGNMRLQGGFDCTTCHATMNAHQGNTCLDCHDPHGNSNLYMVESSSTPYSGTVTFTSITGNNSYDEADGANGDDICATCHTGVAHNRADATGPAHNEGTDCFACHLSHADAAPFSVGAGTSCNGCHGFPPATAAHAAHDINTVNTDAEDRTDCANCHTGADSYTYAGTGDQPGLPHGDAATRLTNLNTSVGYNATNKNCTTACHTATVANGGTWTNGATLDCDACHYYSVAPTSAGNTAAGAKALGGTHNSHFDANKTCADCHAVPTTLIHIRLADGANDLQKIQDNAVAEMDEASILGAIGTEVDPGNSTCNNAACHNPSGTTYSATWNGPAATCDTCHSSTDPATSNHTAHLNAQATFGVNITCNSCHVDNLANMIHLDGTVDMAGEVTAFADPSCTNNCHENGRNGAAAVTATWGMVPQANCTICHDQQPATGSHAKHLTVAAGAACTDCHDTTIDNTTAASQHLDLDIDAFDTTAADLGYPVDKTMGSAFATCNAASCHTDGTNNTPVTTPAWGTNSACIECHTTMTLNGPPNGSHVAHMTSTLETLNCGMCHASQTDVATDTEPNFSHRDGFINATEGYPSPKAIGSAYATCSSASDGTLLCHDNGLNVTVATPVWGTVNNDCSTCHETQPSTGSHAVHLTVAAGGTCGSCHTGAIEGTTPSTQHGDDNLDVTNGYPANVAKGNGTWATCNAASCHNDGQSGNNADLGNVGATLVTTPTWGTPATCSECHVAVPSSAKHDEHLGSYGASCGDCHDGAIQNSNGGNNHTNGVINVVAALNYTAGGAPGNGWGTCTNNAGLTGCHPSQVRNWDETGPACNSCHGQSTAGSGEPLIAGDFPSGGNLPIGQHNAHVNAESMGCGTCHTGGHNETDGLTGQDDKIQISFTGLGSGGAYNPPGTWTAGKWLYDQTSTNARQDCSNLYCHSSGQADGGVGAANFAIPDWGVTSTGQCGSCHLGDGVQGDASTIATGSHTVHLADSADCNNCHSGNTHVNQLIDVTSVTYTAGGAPGNGYGSCSTANCHDNGTGTVVATPIWGAAPANCTECHAAAPTTNAHPIHLGAGVGATCGDCHQGAVQGSNAGVAHRDGTLDTVAALGYNDSTKGAPFGTCATASCHDDGLGNAVTTPAWDNAAVVSCTACHTAAPTTGSHSVHFTDGAACNVCHDGAVESTTASTNHLSAAVNIDATPTNTYANDPAAIGAGSWTTCATANCHVTGQATNDYAVTPTWGVDAPNCTQCHAAAPTTGSHALHIPINNDCATCHTGAVIGVSYGAAAHRDDNVDVAVGSYTANKALGAAAESCASISCHSDGLTATTGTSPIWGTATPACTACHEAVPTTGSHGVHLADGATCTTCHKDAVESTTAPTVIHTDGDVDVFNATAGDLGYPNNAAIGSGSWSTCNAASCHDNGTGTLVTTPAWGTASTCNECHAAVPSTNAHGTHLALSGVNCGTCHQGAVQSSNAGVAHRDGSLDTVAGLGYSDSTKGAPYGTCSTASCHNNGLGVNVPSPAWNGSTNCASCHAVAPATGSHGIHLAASATCGNCHSNAVQNNTAPTAVHANSNVDVFDAVSGDLGYPTTAVLGAGSWNTCDAASCHDDGTGTLVTTPTWGANPPNCSSCHDAAPTTGAHQTHLTSTIIATAINCATCHVGTTESTTAGAGHTDGNIDVSGGYGYPTNKTKGSAYSTCATSYCHGEAIGAYAGTGTTNTPNWGASSTGCDFCHDMATNEIGSHVGIPLTGCVTCHGVGKGNVNSTGTGFTNGGATHINGVINGGGDNCNDCHSSIGGASNGGTALSAAHTAHVTTAYTGALSTSDYGNAANGWYKYSSNAGVYDIGCGFCHPATVAGHTTKQVSLDPTLDAANIVGTVKALNDSGASYAGAGGSCSSVYCHSDGNDIAGGTSPNWNGGSILGGDCAACHTNAPSTGAHSVHTVGIHYTDLYDSDRAGVMQAASLTNAAHGNAATATTITCALCHSTTVSVPQNDQELLCATCHGSTATLRGDLAITGTGTHINGTADVQFNLAGFKTTAQLRDDLDFVPSLIANWNRTNGYKQIAGTSHDVAKLGATYGAPGSGSCSAIVCHNGGDANWSDSTAGNCQKCHTELPQ